MPNCPAESISHWYRVRNRRCHITNIPDKASVAHVFTSNVSSDTNNVTGRGNIKASEIAQGRVAVAERVVPERVNTAGRVAVTAAIAKERVTAAGCVVLAVRVAIERLKTDGRVVVASSVGLEGVMAVGRIVVAGSVLK